MKKFLPLLSWAGIQNHHWLRKPGPNIYPPGLWQQNEPCSTRVSPQAGSAPLLSSFPAKGYHFHGKWRQEQPPALGIEAHFYGQTPLEQRIIIKFR